VRTLIQPLFVLLLFVCVRAGDLAISAGLARSTARMILYGVTCVLALIAIIVSLFGL
jgi:hypothetical protein